MWSNSPPASAGAAVTMTPWNMENTPLPKARRGGALEGAASDLMERNPARCGRDFSVIVDDGGGAQVIF